MVLANNTNAGGCQPEMDNLPVMAYVPWQQLKAVYEPENAWRNGTLFPEIRKPFAGRCCRRG
ncbi:MAG: spore coat associated protein CotJA [Clostridia bacterium]|nr:spore coat associated protein CotJA [Clostridia bacterium]